MALPQQAEDQATTPSWRTSRDTGIQASVRFASRVGVTPTLRVGYFQRGEKVSLLRCGVWCFVGGECLAAVGIDCFEAMVVEDIMTVVRLGACVIDGSGRRLNVYAKGRPNPVSISH
jgi:hypothetical protein